MTISEVPSKPTNLPATPVEKKVAEHLVKKIINQQDENDSREGVVRVPTRGQVSMNYQNLNRYNYKIAHYLDTSGWL